MKNHSSRTRQISNSVACGRRRLFQDVSCGIGSFALASMLSQDALGRARSSPSKSKPPHRSPTATSVIFLHMVGAPSHLDLFDYKPTLQRFQGKLLPEDLWNGLRLAFIRERPTLLGSPFKFRRFGESDTELSELLPHLARVVDDLAIVKTCHTDQFNHAPAQLMMQTGFGQFGRPSLGSWTSYGLGSENEDLPTFVVLNSGSVAGAGNSLWASGFLPSVYQGVEFRSKGDPVLFLSNPRGISRHDRGVIIDRVNRLNRLQLADVGDPEIATRIEQYELAFRMQTSVPELMDINAEPSWVHQLYGTKPGQESFANHCLLARRMVERGVRFVQLYDSGWDHHGGLASSLPKKCKQVDQPIAALIQDLKQRGMLDHTLVVWASEFGRTPMLQGKSNSGAVQRAGRDHHKDAFTVWLAGGGIVGGRTYGSTDEIGFRPTSKPMHIHDLHATILHAMGLDHEQLTFPYQGRKFRLTDVAGIVAKELFA